MARKKAKKRSILSELRNPYFSFILIFAVTGGIWLLTKSFASYQQAVTNTYSNFAWPYKAEGYSVLGWTLTPESDPSPQGFFWANQFGIKNSSPDSGGYAGLQTSTLSRSKKVAIFSIWNAVGAVSPGTAQPFGGEGVGYQTVIDYDWQVGTSYRFKVASAGSSLIGNDLWSATIQNLATGVITTIGTIEVPGSWGKLNDQVISFTEYFYGNISDCSNIPYAAATFKNFALDGVLPTYQNNTFESGQSCATSSKITNVIYGAKHEIGNPSNPQPPPTIADTAAPVVSIYQPLSGSTVKAGMVSISAAATDASGIKSMQVYIGSSLIASSSSGSIQTSWNAPSPKGNKSSTSYIITVKATDNYGNTGQKIYTFSVVR